MQTRYKYIHFDEIEGFKKTKLYRCMNNNSGGYLGDVKWYGPWRQYCFFTAAACVFNVGCMNDINHFIGQLKNSNPT
ncbi:MAG: hypothetical protein ABFD59_08215 [Smithella sp.]